MTALNPTTPQPVDRVFGIALGYLVSRALHVATELRIADHLAAGPLDLGALSRLTNARPAMLYRLLRVLAAYDVFTEEVDGRFALTPAAALLRDGVLRDGVLLCGDVAGDGLWWDAVGQLQHSVMTGHPAFDHVAGMPFFAHLQQDPERSAWFDRGLANFAAAENPIVAAGYDFSQHELVIDIGGGQGGLLAEVLTRHPTVHATLFDLPNVVVTPVSLDQPRFAGRWDAVAGDFFASVPAGGDAYLLKRILHDWDDDDCATILTCCRRAMADTARVIVVDAVVPTGNTPHASKVMDILMMVFARGRERTEAEFRGLFARSGLTLRAVTPTPSGLSILEAAPM